MTCITQSRYKWERDFSLFASSETGKCQTASLKLQ